MKANKYGDQGLDHIFLDRSVTNAAVERVVVMENVDGAGLQLISEGTTRAIVHNAADAVVAGTGTWSFANGAFTAHDVGGTFTVTGAANPGNNGTFTILTVPNATHVTTATTGLVDETFDADVEVSVTSAPATGAWHFYVSNSYTTGDANAQRHDGAPWTEITADTNMVKPTPATVAAGATLNQAITIRPFDFRALKIEFVPTAAGDVACLGMTKGTR